MLDLPLSHGRDPKYILKNSINVINKYLALRISPLHPYQAMSLTGLMRFNYK